MTTTGENDHNKAVGEDQPWPRGGHRSAGGTLAISIDEILNHMDGVAISEEDPARLSLDMLLAIYHEVRYGNDQAARQSKVMVEHTKALQDHAKAMDQLRGALADHATALDRYRFGDR